MRAIRQRLRGTIIGAGILALMVRPSAAVIVDNKSILAGRFDQVAIMQGGLADEVQDMDSAHFVLVVHKGLLQTRTGARGLGDGSEPPDPSGLGVDAPVSGDAAHAILLWCQDHCIEHRPDVTSLDIRTDGTGRVVGHDDVLGVIDLSWTSIRADPFPNWMSCRGTGLIGGSWETETITMLHGGQAWRTAWDGSIGLYKSYPQLRCPGEASREALGTIEVSWSEHPPL